MPSYRPAARASIPSRGPPGIRRTTHAHATLEEREGGFDQDARSARRTRGSDPRKSPVRDLRKRCRSARPHGSVSARGIAQEKCLFPRSPVGLATRDPESDEEKASFTGFGHQGSAPDRERASANSGRTAQLLRSRNEKGRGQG